MCYKIKNYIYCKKIKIKYIRKINFEKKNYCIKIPFFGYVLNYKLVIKNIFKIS